MMTIMDLCDRTIHTQQAQFTYSGVQRIWVLIDGKIPQDKAPGVLRDYMSATH